MPDTDTASEDIADVGLLLEGTYPYVLGGVSAWVDQIIRGIPDVRFALFFIGSQKELNQKQHYKMPANVVSITEVYLHDRLSAEQLRPGDMPKDLRNRIYEDLGAFYLAKDHPERAERFWRLLEGLEAAEGRFTFGNLAHDRESWEILREVYEVFAPNESFIDFFWTVRFLHLPLWSLWLNHTKVPAAKMYHSISAGYAGWSGCIASRQRNVPYVLTEHGIYTKERIAEISQADWIYEPDNHHVDYSQGLGKLKQMWIGLFTFLGRLAYDTADPIITLYEGNALTQMEFGAEGSRIEIVPNGIEPSKFDAIYQGQMERWQSSPPVKTVGFIGRVVPIKDVKTLLRAARLVCEKIPEVRFWIAGPYAEDPNYFDECQKIVKLLRIEDKVHFLGMQKIMDVLPQMDVLVLTSISEGLPLVVLEGMAAGLPNVATDVGACRELIFGRSPEDKALGRAGRLTKILSPPETANALISILQSPEQVRRMGAAGRKRAENHYSMKSMLGYYSDLYRRLSERGGGKLAPEAASTLVAANGHGTLKA
jgi:glycosyltransferase involved in cell wall biosynthesis